MIVALQEVFSGIYNLEIPIPNNPLKALNSYIVLGAERALVIDVGLNRAECLAAMRRGLANLNLDVSKVDFFLTHMHADHSGAIGELMAPGAKAYASDRDADVINNMNQSMEQWNRMEQYARRCGFPEPAAAIEHHPGFRYGNRREVAFIAVRDGDYIKAGRYKFRCVATPGHTRGHMCLYEPTYKILFSGDHVLNKITPNISSWAEENPLADYMASLDKVASLDVGLFLPGHRYPGTDLRKRIAELKEHHRLRSDDITGILGKNRLTPYEVAARMRWDLSYTDWELFPPPQKWFAAGEAVAHLQYLEALGQVTRIEENGNIYYRLV
ncbi:MAG: MBL fold metallo-hydrolase [Negativicutes bacterium]|nr:MBL fold metallo-hydrolase [Negativicutes bacterium]